MVKPCTCWHEDTILQADPWVQIMSKTWVTWLSYTSQNQVDCYTLPFWRKKQHLPQCTLLHWRPLSCVGLLPLGWEEEGKSHRHENQTGNWISAEPVFVCILPARQKEDNETSLTHVANLLDIFNSLFFYSCQQPLHFYIWMTVNLHMCTAKRKFKI